MAEERQGGTTGGLIVVLGRRPTHEALAVLARLGAPAVALSSDWTDGPPRPDDAHVLLLERLGVAVLRDGLPEGTVSAAALPGVHLEEERWVRLPEPRPVPSVAAAPETGRQTWGLRALGPASGLTGEGVGVAVLDTGVDLTHPDLHDRLAATTSLVPGEDAADVHGHGTHCAGTVAGAAWYGVAPAARLHVGKVLDRDGRGRESDVLAGIEWAVGAGCRVVSMSLSSPGEDGPSAVFQGVAADLLDDGVVLVAASGNESARSSGRVAPVGRPASSPSVVAVGAVGRDLSVADFSNGGPQLDVVGPGVDVVSAWPGGRHRALDGTSMATPHVAGVLALLAQQRPGADGHALVRALRDGARTLPGADEAVGSGLVQRPAPA